MTPCEVIAIFEAKDGCSALLGRALLALVPPTRLESGSIEYRILQSGEDPAKWVAKETWRSTEEFHAHMAAEHVQGFLGQVSELCSCEPAILLLSERSDASS